MKRSRNDIRERNGRWVFVFGICFFASLFGYTGYTIAQFINGIGDITASWSDHSATKNRAKEEAFFFNQLMIPGQEYHFAYRPISDTIFTYALVSGYKDQAQAPKRLVPVLYKGP